MDRRANKELTVIRKNILYLSLFHCADFIGYGPERANPLKNALSSYALPKPESPNLNRLDLFNLHYIATNVITIYG